MSFKKKYIFLLVFLAAGVAVTYYWWTGTPQYSLFQIRRAIDNHDPELGMKYIDGEQIFESFWEDITSQMIEETSDAGGFEALGAMLGMQMVEGMKPALKNSFLEGLGEMFEETTGVDKETSSLKTSIKKGDIEVRMEGSRAYVDLEDDLSVVLTKKQGERYWVISEVEGAFNGQEFLSEGNTQSEVEEKQQPPEKNLNEKVTVTSASKRFLSGTYEDYLVFALTFLNKTNKDIKGVQGSITFIDMFGEEIYTIRVKNEDGIGANKTAEWEGSIDYNQFIDAHVKLKNADPEDTTFEWETKTIVYQDGTKETK